MEAIILAGGFGTRLKSVLKDIPKPMADIDGRPFLSYLMDYLSDKNISKVLLSVGYKYKIISGYFGSQYKTLPVEYVIEDRPLGTGGALREALKRVNGDDAVVLNGDTFLNIDLRKMIDFHYAYNSLLTLAVKPMHNFDRYGTVIVREDRVIGFEEKSLKDFGYVNGGIYVMKKRILEFFQQNMDTFSFEVDFLHKEVKNISPIAFICDSYFIDIGIPKDYEKAQQELGNIFKGVAR